MSSSPAHPKVAVITGASSGIGLVTAKALASQGWNVIALGRNLERTAAAEAEIRAAAAPGVRVDMIRADLSLVADAIRAADEIAALTDHIDALLNNAGGTGKEKVVTAEGNEATFAGNHLGHFALTNRLLPLLRAAAANAAPGATRIVSVSSKAHEYTPGFDWNNVQMLDNFIPALAYCNAKLANLLFTLSLTEKLASEGIVAHAMHPGAVASNFASHGDAAMQENFKTRTDLLSPEEAAETLIWLATAPEPGSSNGLYYFQCQPIESTAAAKDAEAAQRLWQESEKLVAASLG